MRLAFAGTPEFARVALAALIAQGHQVELVLTQSDRPAGRGMKTSLGPVKACAVQHGIPVLQPRGLKLDGRFAEDAAEAHARLRDLAVPVLVVAAYGLILPQSLLDIPATACLNIHASLLPRWRGAAPIERAIEAGDNQTGVTIMRMEAGLDTGPLLLSRATPIDSSENAAHLRTRLADLGAAAIGTALEMIAAGPVQWLPQAENQASYAAKLDKAEAAVDFRLTPEALVRRIHAFDPQPGVLAHYRGTPVRLCDARVSSQAQQEPAGTITALDRDGVHIACSGGAICVTELQRSGARRLPAGEFLRGFALEPGERFA